MSADWVGRNVPRKEGHDKVTGATLYVDDLPAEGVLHGATVRAPVARARLKGLDLDGDFPWDEFVIVTADDIPGDRQVHIIDTDQPFLAKDVINHAEEPVALIAHPDRDQLVRGLRHIRVEYEPLPPVLTIEDALAADPVIWGEDNVFKEYRVERGDVDAAFAAAAHVVEGTYRTGAQEQLYIEPNGMIADCSPERGVTVRGSMQCPYYIQKGLEPLFGLPDEKVRIIQVTTGGGFGGKEEYPTLIAGHAALLSWKAGRPVKIVYDREEDMVATTKRHPSRTIIRSAVDADGRLLALDIDFVIDGGAYLTLSPVVLSRGAIHAQGPYRCDNVRIRARAVATNSPPHGAFRGFGAPQSLFAIERHMDRVAATVGLDPVALRRKSFLKKGDTLAVGQVIHEDVDMDALVDQALRESGWEQKRARFAEENARPGARVKRGLGIATFFHGSGFTGAGEVHLASVCRVEATAQGRVRVLAASTEIGQGANTVFSQIAAEALGVDYERVEIVQPDTRVVPDSGPTVASRTTMIAGKLVERACGEILEKLRGAGLLAQSWDDAAFAAACAAYCAKNGSLEAEAQYEKPPDVSWDEAHFRGDAYGCYSWAAYVAEVSVDALTYEARCTDFVAVQEVGRVIHPLLAAGQIEGGVAQGIGWALYENVIYDEGRVVNGQMTNYIMPTSMDAPPIRVFFAEHPYPYGPKGAKGIGELPMDGPAPAIAAAVEHATGLAIDRLPILPETVFDASEKSGGAR